MGIRTNGRSFFTSILHVIIRVEYLRCQIASIANAHCFTGDQRSPEIAKTMAPHTDCITLGRQEFGSIQYASRSET